jgi:hypothetical protein
MRADVDTLMLNDRLARLQRHYAARGGVEKALLDEGVSSYLVIFGAVAIMGFELAVNLGTAGDWSFTAHLIVVGTLELFLIGYFVYALYRKYGLRLRMLAVTKHLTRLEQRMDGGSLL